MAYVIIVNIDPKDHPRSAFVIQNEHGDNAQIFESEEEAQENARYIPIASHFGGYILDLDTGETTIF